MADPATSSDGVVRVLAIADEVVDHLDVAAIGRIAPDLVLAAGDLPWDYLEYFASATDAPLVFVPGNHDPEIPGHRLSRGGFYVDSYGRPADDLRPCGGTNADGRVVEAAGLRIAGLGGCVRYNEGPHQYTQRQYARKARALRRRCYRVGPIDVLLTHAPPRGLGDGDDGPHVGIDALVPFLEHVQPTWHLHGHIHPYGEPRPDRTSGPTTIRNVIPYVVMDITSSRSSTSSSRETMVR